MNIFCIIDVISALKEILGPMSDKERQIIQINRNIIRGLTVVGLILTIFLAVYIYRIGYSVIMENIQEFLVKVGPWGPLIFIVIQLGQVMYPVIPGGLSLVVGQLIFGHAWGFLYSFIGVTLGSMINFYLARKFGKTFVRAFVMEETYEKYYAWITKGKRFEIMLGTAFALPGFPDDFLCMIAGLTNMTFKRFMFIYFIFKPITLYIYGFGGASATDWLLRRFIPFGL